MGKTLAEVAEQLSTGKVVKKTVPEKTKEVEEVKPVSKVQLIYAFNGTGKTRLSQEFKQHIWEKYNQDDKSDDPESSRKKFYITVHSPKIFSIGITI